MRRYRSFILITTTWFLVHVAVWLIAYKFFPSQYPFPGTERSRLDYWDAWHYSAIATEGYTGPVRWAFYPLYPLLVGLLSRVVFLKARPELVGTAFSTLAFAGFCWLQARFSITREQRLHGLLPETVWGWAIFLAWPSSWVFHSHHTESLFILLSFLAFVCMRYRRWTLAAVLAGLCALTRNQGVFVAIAVAFASAAFEQRTIRRLQIFAASGAISLLLFSLWPLYQLWAAGSPTMSLSAQAQFAPQATTLHQFFGTIWFANFWQHQTWSYYLHHLAFIVLNIAAGLLIRRREYSLSLYALMSLWVPLYLGQLENQFRYGALLFPALFALGDASSRLPTSVRWALFAALVWLNLYCTFDYGVGLWGY